MAAYDRIHYLLSEVHDLIAKQDYDDAHDCFEKILKIAPAHQQAMQEYSNFLIMTRDYDKAIQLLTKAIQTYPAVAKFFFNLAYIYKCKTNYEVSKSYLEQAIKLKKDYAEAYNGLGALYFHEQNYDKALEYYQKSIHFKPDYIESHFNLGLVFVHFENYTAALKQFRNTVKLDPKNFHGLLYLGTIYSLINKFRFSEFYFKKALEINNKAPILYNNFAISYLKQKKYQQASDYFKEAITLDPDYDEARSNLGNLYLQRHFYREAAEQFTLLLSKNIHDADLNYNLAICEMALAKPEKAEMHLKEVIKHHPKYISAYLNLGAVYIRENRYDDAKNIYQQIQTIDPDDEISNYMLHVLNEKQEPLKAPSQYISALFDQYAYVYDTHMLETLNYKVPTEMIKTLLQLHINLKDYKVLDLGCGTGITGELLRPQIDEVTGMDLSREMLKIAARKKIYNSLIQADIFHPGIKPATFDLVTAADVLVYMGDLNKVFEQVFGILKSRQYFIFSIETLRNRFFEFKKYQLQKTGRYKHSHFYIKSLARKYKFNIIDVAAIELRKHDNQNIAGAIYVLQKRI